MKNKKISGIFLCLFLVVIFSGCGMFQKRSPVMENGKPVSFTMYPEDSLGVRKTKALESGNVTVFANPMSDGQIGGEAYPGRIDFPGVAVNEKNEITFGQSVMIGNYRTGEFKSYVIVDGEFSKWKNSKFLPLASFTEFGWDKFDNPIPIDKQRFHEETAYVIEIANKYGIPLRERVFVKGFDEMVRSWNLYSTEHGEIYSPLSVKDIQEVARINPGYSPVEKLVLRNVAVISTNPAQMVALASITVFKAMTGKNLGWDIGSLVRREQMSWIIEFIGSFRKEMIRELLVESEKKDAEISELKKIVEKTNLVEKQIQPKKITKKRRGL
jgi:hypothetical protein